MNDRTLVKLRCNKEMLDIRTVSWTRKSPYSFSILRSELQQLEQRPQNRLISGDCGSFAVLLNIPSQTGQQNGGNRSRVTVEMSPGVRLQVQAVE